MTYDAKTPEDYISQVPEERQDALKKLRKTINDNLPKGFKECINYNMIGYVVPHDIYPDGYHCDPKLPLPFMSFASQKNSINFYHSGIYANPELHDWFVKEYPKHCKRKLDMGKSCVRFKKIDEIPYELIAELVKKMSVEQWITIYESALKKK
ncbi:MULTISPECIES: DUF1801 domain-containing protein [Mesoflavibacter]|uniref:DUF1801 domain-containing protein n=1 Tax=Mesoflavibacter profundi TaxID=2708110 RepID=A0ABT4S2N8_9FLAO|nr:MULTISPECIES: DUF1801 domain-containing protein [Mesoflavibacter]MDA0178183.1 DUF1801 domain-containing protein [Mesoflavibacter profundi]QIJ89144.1 DUF1801 domain-containing protein [Mesoflavibacter sp. HG96]QIJ91872.1 DUF1801 domain-containing protein [Mesoflavibacter sp. HG37]